MKVELYFNDTRELIGRFDLDIKVQDIPNSLYKVGSIVYEATAHTKGDPVKIMCEEIKAIDCFVTEL